MKLNKDVLYLPKGKIKEAAKRFETPFFLYEEARIRANCQRFKKAFTQYFPDFQPLYAVKANSNPHVLKIVLNEGYWFDTSSFAEAWLAKKLGAKGMHTGNYTTPEEFKMVKKTKLIVNLDDESMLPTIQPLYRFFKPKSLSFRINPGMGKGGTAESNVLAGPDAKYGIPFEKAAEAYAGAKKWGVKHLGIHMMTGSNVIDEKYFSAVVEKLLRIIADIKQKTGVEIDFMNIGGGFGVPYEPQQKSLDLEKVAKGIRKVFDVECKNGNIKPPRLMAEPGRYIAADAGWLIGEVQVIKDGYKKFVGIDASCNDMPRPSIYGAYHHITVLNNSKKQETVSVVGSICENNDQFCQDRKLPVASIGDLIAIHNCGAHAYSMGHNYNGKLRHAEYLLKPNGAFKKIRRAETVDDLFRTVF